MRIKTVTVFRIDASEEEIDGLRNLLTRVQQGEETMTATEFTWFEEFGVEVPTTALDDDEDFDDEELMETLPEKALRVSGNGRGRRKGRLTPTN